LNPDAPPSSRSWLGCIYYTVNDSPNLGSLPPNVFVAVNDMAFVNTLSGQLDFRCLDDKVGRKSVYGVTLLMMIV
jgi:PHS family inorganic phosphate transporter-like MFS transporter